MADLARYRALDTRERALVALAVLLDGHDAAEFLQSDRERSPALIRAAKDLASISLELRMPLLGTLLRDCVEQLESAQ